MKNQLEQKWQIKDQIDKRIANQQPATKIQRQSEKLSQLYKRFILAIDIKCEKYSKHTESLSKQLI